MIHKEQALKAIVEANVESKYYNMIDGKNIFDQPIKDNNQYMKTKKLLQVKEMITQHAVC